METTHSSYLFNVRITIGKSSRGKTNQLDLFCQKCMFHVLPPEDYHMETLTLVAVNRSLYIASTVTGAGIFNTAWPY